MKESGQKISRRGFLGMGAVAGIAAGVAAMKSSANPKEAFAAEGGAPDLTVKYHNSIDDLFQFTDEFERYDAYKTAFNRIRYAIKGKAEPITDEDYEPFVEMYSKPLVPPYTPGETPGYDRVDSAFKVCAAGTAQAAGAGSGSNPAWYRDKDGTIYNTSFVGNEASDFRYNKKAFAVNPERHEFESIEKATYTIKKVATKYGASIVGIAPYDERFVFKSVIYDVKDAETGKVIPELLDTRKPVEFNFEPKSVIVIGYEMDYEAYKMSPSLITGYTNRQAYCNNGLITFNIAMFLRTLGYNARNSENDMQPLTAWGIMAGLGESSRMGMLVTKEFGPRLRLSVVYTDLELNYDKPKTFGVREFCEVCQVCADLCPSGAVSKVKSPYDPENKPMTIGEQKGVIGKWYLHSQKCLSNWYFPVGQCELCVAVCPYNKPQTWNHDLVKLVTLVPGLNSLARYFDHFFGFGSPATQEEMIAFWERTV